MEWVGRVHECVCGWSGDTTLSHFKPDGSARPTVTQEKKRGGKKKKRRKKKGKKTVGKKN
jgi:hypothetical protein